MQRLPVGGGVRANTDIRYEGGQQGLPYPPDLLAAGDRTGVMCVTQELVDKVLGPPRFATSEAAERVSCPGTAAGLVWTAAGGMVQYVECCRISDGTPGKAGQLTLTGQVGEVLEESARIALSWTRAHAEELGLELRGQVVAAAGLGDRPSPPGGVASGGVWPLGVERRDVIRGSRTPPLLPTDDDVADAAPRAAAGPATAMHPAYRGSNLRLAGHDDMNDFMGSSTVKAVADDPSSRSTVGGSADRYSLSSNPALTWDIHIHLPAGAVPKDGPSAGITLAVALISLLSGRCVRADTAMTGELTLRGLVLPVGGIKEKLLAARHAGCSRVIVPARNMRDVEVDVPAAVKQALEIIPAERLEDVLLQAFDPPYMLLPRPRL